MKDVRAVGQVGAAPRRRPSTTQPRLEGELHHALCYQVVGNDMEVSALEVTTWHKFRQGIGTSSGSP